MIKKILITGGAGYIGSHITELFINNNFEVYVIDNLKRGFKQLLSNKAVLIKKDIRDTKFIKKFIIKKKINTIIHLAALTDVQESETYKKMYYENNVVGTANLLEACKNTSIKTIIYSSSAGVYGKTKNSIKENNFLKPINYYSYTKLCGEKLLMKFSKKNNINYFILRYFNVCGASPSGKIGIISKKNKSLFKIISNQIFRKYPKINIFGNKFNTKDGTCIRDFIHVYDLAIIHLKILKYISKKRKSQILNCGYGKGYSVLEIIKAFQKLTKKNIKIVYKKKRKGEIIASFSNNKKLMKLLKWKPKYENINSIIKSSLEWEKNLINSKKKLTL
tara:strand:- start:1006 stop:2007 length:1002 start_codon:yes stop_codon:yes gene_type:complete